MPMTPLNGDNHRVDKDNGGINGCGKKGGCMRNDSFSIVQLFCCLWITSYALPIADAHAKDYLIQAGDTLELSVAGAPELRQRIPVNVQGVASFPLVGDIEAAGKSLKEVRSKVQET